MVLCHVTLYSFVTTSVLKSIVLWKILIDLYTGLRLGPPVTDPERRATGYSYVICSYCDLCLHSEVHSESLTNILYVWVEFL